MSALEPLLIRILGCADLAALRLSIQTQARGHFGLKKLDLVADDSWVPDDRGDQAHARISHGAGQGSALLIWEPVAADPSSVADWGAFTAAVAKTLERLLKIRNLNEEVRRLQGAERVQRALFAIADMASSELDMPEMLRGMHQIVGELMYAENFMIALHDSDRDVVRFIYFADVMDNAVFDTYEEFPASELANSLTLALIRQGQPQMGPSNEIRARLGVPKDDKLGPDSEDWLGIPIIGSKGSSIRGAVVVQSYDPKLRFGPDDQALLSYVAQHIMTALERKQARDELERRVAERTHELARANDELRYEVAERHRGEKLQAALFRIAELSSTTETLEEFYAAVHGIVGELLYARNFFIALLSEDATELVFHYSVDEVDALRPRRKLAKGLSEYVLRTGRALLVDRAMISAMAEAGEVASFGAHSVCWLGVPLICDERTVGVLAVQSYSPEIMFNKRDQELLTFVGFHIATGLERKRAQDSLRAAYADLEQRVAERTRELAATNQELIDQISERERIEERLKHQALHDALTGLPNRSYLLDRLGLALMRYQLNRERDFAVLFLDLDRFKVINDSVGHLIGDEMLKQAATRVRAAVDSRDTVARLGGDEFAILLEDLDSIDRASTLAKRVIESLSEPMRVGNKELFTSASIGIAASHPRYLRAEELLRDADVAMYRAKAEGRQRFELFDERLRAEALRVLDLEGDLRRAIARNEFEPHFQTIVSLTDEKVIGYEALLRWHHPERGLLLPADFLGVAEDNGSIEQIDWEIFAMSCRLSHLLPNPDAYVGINVSARQFRTPDFDRTVLNLIESNQIRPQRIRLEVTEGALLENSQQIRRILENLRNHGVLAQLDDFGTGYSSLSYLHQFPIHALKIDRSFVADLGSGRRSGSAAVVRAIGALAQSMNLEVIAEGIETTLQRSAVEELGCRVGQGFLFSQPRPASEIAAMAERPTAAGALPH
ncbi:MAG: EAL domain-containing protein [Xanthomonadales bacterium]|nr:EAL domain-containing protein [Xanthomonadales bacterium]